MWQDAAAPLTDEWKAKMKGMGLDGDAILGGLVAELKKYHSLYGDTM